jgi:hypothetical protein
VLMSAVARTAGAQDLSVGKRHTWMHVKVVMHGKAGPLLPGAALAASARVKGVSVNGALNVQ